jgi:RNA polymerase sigma-70 factor (ECF subfamily)
MADIDARFRKPLMSFFLRRVRDRTEAEDLTQQVFLRLVGAESAERAESLDAFTFTIATNLLRDRVRGRVRRPEVGEEALGPNAEISDHLVEEISPERVLIGRERLSEVLATLDELGDRTRDIFVLFRLEKMKQRDIAALLGMSQSTVEKHVMKATLHLALKYGSN